MAPGKAFYYFGDEPVAVVDLDSDFAIQDGRVQAELGFDFRAERGKGWDHADRDEGEAVDDDLGGGAAAVGFDGAGVVFAVHPAME